jgi:hypothetical protein
MQAFAPYLRKDLQTDLYRGRFVDYVRSAEEFSFDQTTS